MSFIVSRLTTLRNWLDNRTGYHKLLQLLLIEPIPGGARWRYVWGSCLAFFFGLQVVTGLLLMTAYSPGASTSWASVYFIQYEMDFGWLIRGLHHFSAGVMVALLCVHVLQVVLAGANLPPREINWWLGLILLGLTLAMGLTGYLLPWDQKGYWATQVATNILGNLPLIGPWLQKIIVGGPAYGHHTLTRFYALHVAILPLLIVLVLAGHLAVFRRHGVTAPKKAQGEGMFWPDQMFKDAVAWLVLFGILLFVVIRGEGHKIERPAEEGAPSFYQRIALAGREGRGANLDAPADPSREYPARPEWYFLFLFQLLKYFEGKQEIIGTIVIPSAVALLLFLLPLLGHGRLRPLGHVFGFVVVVSLLGTAAGLTFRAVVEDRANAEFQTKLAEADALAQRSLDLAHEGIPAGGPHLLLQRDPMTRGRELFRQHCVSCHSYKGEFEEGEFKAADLAGYGSKEWILGLLHDPGSPHYFGRTNLKEMRRAVKDMREEVPEKELEEEWQLIAEWLAGHPRAPIPSENDTSAFAKGYRAFERRCSECHTYRPASDEFGKAPDFTGFGDADWLRLMIMSPNHPRRYGSHGTRNTMPAFRDLEGSAAEATRQDLERIKELLLEKINVEEKDEKKKEKLEEAARRKIEEASHVAHLSDLDRELIIRFILKDHRLVFGGDPIRK